MRLVDKSMGEALIRKPYKLEFSASSLFHLENKLGRMTVNSNSPLLELNSLQNSSVMAVMPGDQET